MADCLDVYERNRCALRDITLSELCRRASISRQPFYELDACHIGCRR